MGYAYDVFEAVWYPYVNRDDYVFHRLPDDTYEFIQLACHSWSYGHHFTDGGYAYSNDIRNAPPRALFYNLFACGALRFTDYNCLGNAYILNTNTPSLTVIGSTKSGSMLNFRDFYEPIGNGYSIGEAFRMWFEDRYPYSDDPSGYNEVSWYYGMTILGDPTLVPQTPTENTLHDFITIYNDGEYDLIVSDITIHYKVGEPTGWLDVNPKSFTVKASEPRSVTVTIDVSGLTKGVYHGWLHIHSNDPDENPYNVTVTLQVVGDDVGIVSISPIGTQPRGIYNINATVKNCGVYNQTSVTINCSIYETVFAESFETYPYVPPYGWATVNNAGEWRDSLYGSAHSGDHWAYAWGAGGTPDCWLITPQITLPTNATLSFWYRAEDSSYPVAFEVAISTSSDQTDITQFVTIWDSGMINNAEYQEQLINLSSYAGQNVYIAFHHYDAANGWWGLCIDDIIFLPYNLIYYDEKVIAINAGEEKYVEFSAWNASTESYYIINVSAELSGDERPSNNYREEIIAINDINDTGVTHINSPTSMQSVGLYTVNATVRNYGNIEQTNVVTNCSIYWLNQQIAFFDDVESGLDGWWTYDGTGAGDLWHITTTRYHSSSHSWYCGNETTGSYNNNMYNYLVSPSIDLSNAVAATLSFWMYMHIEDHVDYLYLWIYDGSNFVLVEQWTGYESWTKISVDLSQFAGKKIWLYYIFYSDGYNTWSGVWLDDIEVKKYVVGNLTYYDEQIIVSISPGEEKYVEFSAWNASTGFYLINVTTKLLGDEDPANDYKTAIVHIMPTMVYVDDDYNASTPGWQLDHFDSIQDGIDNVYYSGVVYVLNGTYYENVKINRAVNIIGENKTTTILDGSWKGYAFEITADGVSIYNLTMQNCWGVVVQQSNNIHVYSNVIHTGVQCYNSQNIRIENNSIDSYIYIWHSRCSIKNNSFSYYGGIEINGYYLEDFIQDIENNDILGKPIYYFLNQTGITVDGWTVGEIILVNCDNLEIKNLDISYAHIGIEIIFSNDISINNNALYYNSYGLMLHSSSSIIIEKRYGFRVYRISATLNSLYSRSNGIIGHD